ncbi:hypothetical protein QYF36_022487 [Acer negundo]|nr:hypothetical protein QYF36_022487 [Acer negundo]
MTRLKPISRLCLGGKSRDTFCRWILLWKGQVPPEYPYKPPGIIMITHSLPMDVLLKATSGKDISCFQFPAFRKLFLEYEEIYNQQRLPEQQVLEQQSTELPKEENSGPKMEKLGNLGEDFKKNLSRHLFILTTWNIYTTKLIKQAMMNKSPTYLDYETSDYGVHEFDPQLDFSQFLEEARQHAKEVNFQASSTYTEETGKKKQLGGEKKIKKSWKNSLLSWWKVHKKSKSSNEPAASSNISKPRKGHVSGPIYGSGQGDEMKLRRSTSGPITNLFNPINRGEDEIPYMCLDQINNSHPVKSYGPVYLVT